MPNICLLLEYDGRNYHGWQRQPGKPTIQGVLEAAIERISGEKPKLIGAGRTDAGVHALGQVANFMTSSPLSPERWQRALNATLPEDIVVRTVWRVPDGFHARRAARSKTYQYRILNRATPSAFLHAYTWHLPYPLRLRRMQLAARYLVGRHEFAAFCGKADAGRSTAVRLQKATVRREGDLVLITLAATHFLRYMVRNITGTLVEVGLGRQEPEWVRAALEARDRRAAGPTAPPQGLFLVTVTY